MSQGSFSLKSRSKDSSRQKYHQTPKKRIAQKYKSRDHRRSRSRSRSKSKRSQIRQSRKEIQFAIQYQNQERSDFLKHLIFRQIPIKKQNEEQFIDTLGNKLQRVGPLRNITILQRYGDKIDVGVGFKYDRDAVNYIEGNKTIEMVFQSSKVSLFPKLSRAFDFYFEKAKAIKSDREYEKRKFQQKRKEQTNKRDLSMSPKQKRQRSRNQRRRSSSSDKSHFISSQISPKKQQRQAILRVFGTPACYSKTEILRSINKFNGGQFQVESAAWQTWQDAKYLRITMNSKVAYSFLKQVQQTSKFNEKAPIIIECDDPRDIFTRLKQYQIKLQFLQKVHPYNLYKCLSKYGQVVQMVTQNEQNREYYITFHNKRAIKDLKNLNLRIVNDGIVISSLKNGQFVYRPNNELRKLMQEDKRQE